MKFLKCLNIFLLSKDYDFFSRHKGKKMRKFGFKFFSTNFQTAPETITECAEFALSKEDVFMEFTAVTVTTDEEFKKIKAAIGNIEVRIHASYDGFDASNSELFQQNNKILASAQKAADIFDAKTIVVHAGYGHSKKHLEEAARQFKLFNDERIVVENLPYYDNNGDEMLGNMADEIAYIRNESKCGFCFDFSHAICSATAQKLDVDKYLQSLFLLKPTVYHMCDGNTTETKDLHLHFGEGNYPLKHYLNDYTDENAYITMETGNGFEQSNDLRIKDYNYLKAIL